MPAATQCLGQHAPAARPVVEARPASLAAIRSPTLTGTWTGYVNLRMVVTPRMRVLLTTHRLSRRGKPRVYTSIRRPKVVPMTLCMTDGRITAMTRAKRHMLSKAHAEHMCAHPMHGRLPSVRPNAEWPWLLGLNFSCLLPFEVVFWANRNS